MIEGKKKPPVFSTVSHSEQGGTQHTEYTLLTVWKETVFTDSTNPKWEVAENNIRISKAITQLQNFLIKVKAQVPQQ